MAINLKALQKVSLKKTSQTSDKSKPMTKTICSDSESYKKLMKETFLEEYLQILEKFTMKTVSLELTTQEADSIRKNYQIFKETYEKPNFTHDFWKVDSILVQLAEKISKKQPELKTENFFIRLSSRSPKDSALSSPKTKEIFIKSLQDLENFDNDEKDLTDINRRVHALYITSVDALKCKDGEDAVRLLVESFRIQDDLEEYSKDPKGYPLSIFLRDFLTFPVELELRAFIYKKKFTSMTQYNQFLFFPRVFRTKDKILEKAKKFVEEELIPKIPSESYVLDLLMTYKNLNDVTNPFIYDDKLLDQLDFCVVELNPLAEFAGTGLFTWMNDWDILTGEKPFEFRIVNELPKNPIQEIDQTWAEHLFIDKNQK
ncbi:cell division cycle protein [Anaeramoeba ignava]|uniref:Cell division cycle protein n=1 Tax=Anaeramoeba ignava TaxID=1746090 RepID=A0A9Q0LGM2_ANAIG|nr:cell division cycle protein [Anaeramoeba ignava]